MAVNVTFKKDVSWLNVIEDMERIITNTVNMLKIDLSNTAVYPALITSGSLETGGIVADTLRTSRRISISGDASGYALFNGSSDINIDLTLLDVSPLIHTHLSSQVADATSINISNTLVKRNELGDFNARVITANLTGNVLGNVTGDVTGNVSGDSSNVTTTIAGKAITSIFEINGTTVKNASNAGYASDSDKVDGLHASAFATASHNHDATHITSGILSSDRGTTSEYAYNTFLRYTAHSQINGCLYGGATAPTGSARLNYSGYLYATRVYNAIYNDYAECFLPDDSLIYDNHKHRIVQINKNGKVELGTYNSKTVVGIISEQYGYLLGGSQEEIDSGLKIPVGLAGTLMVDSEEKVNDSHLGYFIGSSGNGKAVITEEHGCIVGKIIGVDEVNNRYKVIITLR